MEFVHNQTAEIDLPKLLDYLAKQFGKDVSTVVSARDELAKRQGALSAVEDSIKAKVAADSYYEVTKASCDTLIADTKAANDVVKVKKRECADREKAVAKLEADAAKAIEAKMVVLDARESALVADRALLNEKSAALEIAAKNIADAEAAHSVKVKEFHALVATLKA